MIHKTIDGKLWVTDQLRHIGSYEYFDTLKRVIEEIDQHVENGEWRDISLEITEEYGSRYMVFRGYRMATARELKESQDAELKRANERERQEALEYARLKRKFDP
jgi:hypothetical protein